MLCKHQTLYSKFRCRTAKCISYYSRAKVKNTKNKIYDVNTNINKSAKWHILQT